jgi:hypothetical protein
MTLTISHHRSLVRVTGVGFFTLTEARAHFDELALTLTRERSPGRGARVLVDLRLAQTQAQEVATYISERTAALYTAADRVGIVVASPLLRTQLRRVHQTQSNFGVFLDQVEATAFILASNITSER